MLRHPIRLRAGPLGILGPIAFPVCLFSASGEALGHEGDSHTRPAGVHPHRGPVVPTPTPTTRGGEGGVADDADRTTGQGPWSFRWSEELSELPEGAKRFLPGAHGGFAVDWKGQREVYFALKGCGIIKMSADLRRKEIVEVDRFVRQGNFHNTTIVYDGDETPHLALPDDEKERVYILTTKGELVHVLSHPRGNAYYDGWGSFKPTDVEQAPSRDVFIVTGYSPGDFVVSADPFSGAWRPKIFGGKGTEHGKFGTGHGITWNPRTSTLDVSDRPHSRIESYDVDGAYKSSVTLPAGSLPCDVDFLDDWMLVGCLQGPGGSVPAPIYVVDGDGKVASTIKPKEDLGLELFTHVHNASWHAIGDGETRKVYVLAQAWNPGGFAVLERVGE